MDHGEPRDDLGFPHLLLPDGQPVQLRDRRAVRRLADQGHERGQVLVHRRPRGRRLRHARPRLALLLLRRRAHPHGPRPPEAAHRSAAVAAQPGRAEDAVGQAGAPLDPIGIRVRASGGLRPADHVRQDHAQDADHGLCHHERDAVQGRGVEGGAG